MPNKEVYEVEAGSFNINVSHWNINIYDIKRSPCKDMSDDDLAKLASWDETIQEFCKIK